jgi:hypothetical protein
MCLLAMVTSVLVGVSSAGPASALDVGVSLPLGSPRSLVLDEANSHVIASGDPIVVTDYSGQVVATLADEGGASGMVVDGGLLYVARCSASAIDIIDTGTLTRLDSVPISDGIGLTNQGRCELAEAGGRLWFDTNDGVGTLGSVTVAPPHTQVTYTGIDPVDNALFATTPTNPNLLVVASSKYCPTAVQVYDVSAATPNLLRSTTAANGCMRSMQITADGNDLMIATGGVEKLRLSDLAPAAGAPNASYTTAIAQAGDGSYLSVGSDRSPSVLDFRAGQTTAFRQHDWQISSSVGWGDLVMTADGYHLFALAGNYLEVLDGPAQARPKLTVTPSHSTIGIGRAVVLAIHLSGHTTNNHVAVYRTPYHGTRRLVANVAVSALGNATLTLHPRTNTTYQAVFVGEDAYASARSTSRLVAVRVAVSISQTRWYAKSGAYRLYHAGTEPIFTTSVSPNKTGHCIYYAVGIQLSSGRWYQEPGSCIRLGSRSRSRVTVTHLVVGRRYRIRAVYKADGYNAGNTSGYAYFRVTS